MEMENIEIYDYDPNYMYVNEASGEDNVICGMSGNPNDDICEKMVDLVAKQMVTIIKEVIKIRNRIKL